MSAMRLYMQLRPPHNSIIFSTSMIIKKTHECGITLREQHLQTGGDTGDNVVMPYSLMHSVSVSVLARAACMWDSLPSDRRCKVLLWSGQSLSNCDSSREMAENVPELWTPPGALSNLFWQSGTMMAICRSLPLCTQPGAHHTVVTTFLCDIASGTVVRLKKVCLCSLARSSGPDCGQWKQDIKEHKEKQCWVSVSYLNLTLRPNRQR